MSKLDTSLSAQELGIPLVIPISNARRYDYCDAFQATFAGLEGNLAVYNGQCCNRHQYQDKIELEKLRQEVHVDIDGELVYGQEQGFAAEELEEL